GHRCVVQMSRARTVVVTFVKAARVELHVPSRLVLHMPYDVATIVANAEFDGHPVHGVAVQATFTCPGEKPEAHRALSDVHGNVSFTEARDMINSVRILNCSVAAHAA